MNWLRVLAGAAVLWITTVFGVVVVILIIAVLFGTATKITLLQL